MKKIIDKMGLIKIKIFCSVKDPDKKIKRKVTDLEKIFARDVSDKGLLSKRHKFKNNNPI